MNSPLQKDWPTSQHDLKQTIGLQAIWNAVDERVAFQHRHRLTNCLTPLTLSVVMHALDGEVMDMAVDGQSRNAADYMQKLAAESWITGHPLVRINTMDGAAYINANGFYDIYATPVDEDSHDRLAHHRIVLMHRSHDRYRTMRGLTLRFRNRMAYDNGLQLILDRRTDVNGLLQIRAPSPGTLIFSGEESKDGSVYCNATEVDAVAVSQHFPCDTMEYVPGSTKTSIFYGNRYIHLSFGDDLEAARTWAHEAARCCPQLRPMGNDGALYCNPHTIERAEYPRNNQTLYFLTSGVHMNVYHPSVDAAKESLTGVLKAVADFRRRQCLIAPFIAPALGLPS